MKRKRILAAALSFALLAMPLCASARFLEGCYVNEKDNSLVILCADSMSPSGTAAAEQLEITLGDEKINTTQIYANSAAEIAISYCCLVDVSGSMNADQMTQAKETLFNIADAMGGNDTMAIGTLGNNLNISDYTSDKTVLSDTINALAAGNEDTNLYASIVGAAEMLNTSSSVSAHKCLVIISDGMDDMISGYTRDEAIRAVSESAIPVYTVAALRNAQQSESGKSLSEFARLSAGGRFYVPVIDGMSAAQAGQDIVNSMRSGFIVTADLSAVDLSSRDEALLRVRCASGDGSVLEDTMTIYTADLPRVTASPQETEPTPTPEPESASENNKIKLFIIAGAAALLLAVIIILIAVLKKKNRKIDEPIEEMSPDDGDTAEETVSADDESITAETMPDGENETHRLSIRFTTVGNTKKIMTYSISVDKETTFGRNKKADIVLDAEDKQLSGTHFSLTYTNDTLYLQDKGSTNGTFHKGVLINSLGRIILEKDDTIRVGSYEYRIDW